LLQLRLATACASRNDTAEANYLMLPIVIILVALYI